jgi:hypothetical protein
VSIDRSPCRPGASGARAGSSLSSVCRHRPVSPDHADDHDDEEYQYKALDDGKRQLGWRHAWRQDACLARAGPRLAEPQSGPGGSLLRSRHTLFAKQNSLLVRAGNWAKRLRITAFSSSWSGLRAGKIVNYPVKFPVCREFAWRWVRSRLRRQPALKLLSWLCKQLDSRQTFWARLEMELLKLGPEPN